MFRLNVLVLGVGCCLLVATRARAVEAAAPSAFLTACRAAEGLAAGARKTVEYLRNVVFAADSCELADRRLTLTQALDLSKAGLTDLSPLAGAPNVEVLNISDNFTTLGTGIADLTPLTSMPRLKAVLAVACCSSQVDYHQLSRYTPSDLDLSFSLTGAEYVQPRVRRIRLGCQGQPLDVSRIPVTYPGLKELHLSDCQLQNLASLKRLTSLETLSISGRSGMDLSQLNGHASLKSLAIYPGTLLPSLQSFPSLQTLSITRFNDAALDGSQKLKSLDVTLDEASDLAWSSKFPNLESLKVFARGKVQLTGVVNLPRLRSLDVTESLTLGQQAEPMDLTPLGSLTDLEHLRIDTMNWSTKGAAVLSSLKALRTLSLRGPSDLRIEYLKPLPLLQRLSVGGTGLPSLDGIEALRLLISVDVSGNPFPSVAPLAKLPFVTYVNILGTPDDQVAEFEKQRPDVYVQPFGL